MTAELSVVCKSCGSEVSSYVTECPYCGARLRKRAPKLKRDGGELKPRESRRRARRRKRAERLSLAGNRPYATIFAIAAPAVLLIVIRALDEPLRNFGAIVGPVGSEWWRYLAAPFVYADVGYLFVVAVALALFASAVEERLGTFATALLIVACGALGMLAADGIETAIRGDTDITVAAGGNGVALGALAAWFAIRRAEIRRYRADEVDVIGVAVCAVVLLALPVVDDWANVWAGLGGAAVGGLAGLSAALAWRGEAEG
jgi:membrane associated rhomboid family serine protease